MNGRLVGKCVGCFMGLVGASVCYLLRSYLAKLSFDVLVQFDEHGDASSTRLDSADRGSTAAQVSRA